MYTSVGDDRLWYYPFISRESCSFLSEKRFLWESSALGNRGWVDLEPDDPLVVVNFHALVQLRNHLRGQVQGVGKSSRWENGVVPKWRLCCRGVCYSVLQCYSEEFAPERVVPSCWLPPEPRPGHCEGTWAFSLCFIKGGQSFTCTEVSWPLSWGGKGCALPWARLQPRTQGWGWSADHTVRKEEDPCLGGISVCNTDRRNHVVPVSCPHWLKVYRNFSSSFLSTIKTSWWI